MAKVVAAFKGTASDHLNIQEGEKVKILSEVCTYEYTYDLGAVIIYNMTV